MYLTGKYRQKEIADIIGVSEQSIVLWIKELPVIQYSKIRINLAKELERLSRNPSGRGVDIFQYISNLKFA